MTKNPPVPVKLSLLDNILLSVAPKYGRERLINKWGVAQASAQGFFFPMQRAGSGYVTPGGPKTSVRGWLASPNLVDSDTIPALSGLRAGSRDMWTNTPLAVGALRRVQTNVVGFGLMMQSRVDQEALGLAPEEAEKWQRLVEREWRLWCQSKDCDSRRTCDFYELQALAILSEMMSGDVFVFLPYLERKGAPYRLAVQMVEADWISNPNLVMDTLTIAGGVEVDANGAPVAYHLQTLPRDTYIHTLALQTVTKWKRIPAFGADSGRRNVLHLYRVDRPGQRRGVPFLAPVIEQLKNITRLSESELTAAVVSSFFTAFIKDVPAGQLGSGFIPGDTVVDENSPEAEKLYEMGPASIVSLDKGKDITFADPKRPNGAFEPFFVAIVKQVGSALEIPFEQLMQHFTASYSASRGALLEAWKFYKTYRHRLVRNFCQPVYEAWLTEAITSGRVAAPGFFEDPAIKAAWCKTRWIGPGQGQLNPDVESKASIALIDAGLSTHEEEYAERQGGDWEGMAYTLSRELALKEQLNIKSPEQAIAEKAAADKAKADEEKKKEKESDGGY